MTHTSPEFKATLSDIKERIALVKRGRTQDGYIDYNGCAAICREFNKILDNMIIEAEHNSYELPYTVASLIITHCGKLASKADDSYGGITDTREQTKNVLFKVCSNVEYGSKEADYIFLQSLKDSQNKAFDEWEEFAYDILENTAKLATSENVCKLYEVLDKLGSRLSKKAYSSWYLGHDAIVRLRAIKAVDGEDTAEKFIATNISIDCMRKEAINNAIAKSDYAMAEKLCLEKIDPNERRSEYSRPSEWRYTLFEIYNMAEDLDKQIEAANDLLFRFDVKYYDIIKNLLTQNGTWKNDYASILKRIELELLHEQYMFILANENEHEKLFSEVQKYPATVFEYGKHLLSKFKIEVIDICVDEIRKQTGNSSDRTKYKKVCANLRKLYEFGGIVETEALVFELREKYPRRAALLDELDKMMAKMNKKKK